MILSKHDKSYDTSDGTEQPFLDPTHEAEDRVEAAARQSKDDDRAAEMRRQDDGGSHDVLPVRELGTKPSWSVLSLRDLNAAIERERRADDPARLQQDADRVTRAELRAVEVENDRKDEMARAEKNKYRNAWDHS